MNGALSAGFVAVDHQRVVDARHQMQEQRDAAGYHQPFERDRQITLLAKMVTAPANATIASR